MKPIYLYHLTQNGRIRYVGVTTQLDIRKSFWKRTKPPHEFEIIDTFSDKEEAGIAEQYHIAGHNTFKSGWNKSDGGETLLTGDKHPAWKGGISLDMKAYKEIYNKQYYQENKEEKKEYNARPETKAKKRTYAKKNNQTPERKTYMKEFYIKNKAKAKEWRERPEVKAMRKEYQKAYRLRKKALAIT